jgi:hypothetical protein
MTKVEPTHVAAVAVALAVAIALRLVDIPHPWPAAIALNVYGLVAWPAVRRHLPVTQRTYAGGWMAAAVVLVLLEAIAPFVR